MAMASGARMRREAGTRTTRREGRGGPATEAAAMAAMAAETETETEGASPSWTGGGSWEETGTPERTTLVPTPSAPWSPSACGRRGRGGGDTSTATRTCSGREEEAAGDRGRRTARRKTPGRTAWQRGGLG